MKTGAVFSAAVWIFVLNFSYSCEENKTGISDDEYAVYRAVIDTIYVNNACFMDESEKPNEIVLTANTTRYGCEESSENEMERGPFQGRIENDSDLGIFPVIDNLPASKFVQYNFRKVNSASFLIDTRRFGNSYICKTLSRETCRNYFNRGTADGWADFYNDFPDSLGVLSFSRAAFNKSKDICLLYFEYYKDSLDASGNFVFLVKHNRDWTIMEVITDWVS